MYGDDSPSALDAKLFKEGGGNDALVRDEAVWIEEKPADDAHYDDGEAAAKDLRSWASLGILFG